MIGILSVFWFNLALARSSRSADSVSGGGSLLVKITVGGIFSPDNITVVIGVNNTVTWINDDPMPHTITADNGDFNSGKLEQAQQWTYTFNEVGVYPYHCIYHSWMHGVVTVLDRHQ